MGDGFADSASAGVAEGEPLSSTGTRHDHAGETSRLARAANAAQLVSLAPAKHWGAGDGVLRADVGGALVADPDGPGSGDGGEMRAVPGGIVKRQTSSGTY